MHIFLRNKLDELKFRCSKCFAVNPDSEGAQPMNYFKYCDHLSSKCPESFFKCPYMCNPDRYFSQEEYYTHMFENQCPNSFKECEGCQIEV